MKTEQRKPNILAEGPVVKVQAVYVCRGCGSAHVDKGAGPPTECRKGDKCQWGARVSAGMQGERFLLAGDNAAIPPHVPEPAEPEPVEIGDASTKGLKEELKQFADDLQREIRSPDEYRTEWIASAVREWAIRTTLFGVGVQDVWTLFEMLYDAGQKRGHLP